MSESLAVTNAAGARQAKSSTLVAWAEAMAPRSLHDALQLCEFIAKSDLAPAAYRGKPANILVAIQLGAAVGLNPAQSIQGIAVINGKPSLYGDHALAVVKAHPDFESCVERFEDEGGPNWTAWCDIKRKDQPLVKRSFSLKEAEKAKLIGKPGPWQDYRPRMLQMRARSFAMRDAFPDALVGLSIAEEAMDIPEAVVVDANAVVAASRVAEVRDALMAKTATTGAAAETQAPSSDEPPPAAEENWLGLKPNDEVVSMACELGMNAVGFAAFVRDLTGKDRLTTQSYKVVKGALSSKIDEHNETLFGDKK